MIRLLLLSFLVGASLTGPAAAQAITERRAVVPLLALTLDDRRFYGESFVDRGTGRFVIGDDQLLCQGRYDALNPAPVLDLGFDCGNDVTGIAHVVREDNGLAGHGRFVLSDGTRGALFVGASIPQALRLPVTRQP
jgi:hypothetical protein